MDAHETYYLDTLEVRRVVHHGRANRLQKDLEAYCARQESLFRDYREKAVRELVNRHCEDYALLTDRFPVSAEEAEALMIRRHASEYRELICGLQAAADAVDAPGPEESTP